MASPRTRRIQRSTTETDSLLGAFQKLHDAGVRWVAFRGRDSAPPPEDISFLDEHYAIFHVPMMLDSLSADDDKGTGRHTVEGTSIFHGDEEIWTGWYEPSWPWAIDSHGKARLALCGAASADIHAEVMAFAEARRGLAEVLIDDLKAVAKDDADWTAKKADPVFWAEWSRLCDVASKAANAWSTNRTTSNRVALDRANAARDSFSRNYKVKNGGGMRAANDAERQDVSQPPLARPTEVAEAPDER